LSLSSALDVLLRKWYDDVSPREEKTQLFFSKLNPTFSWCAVARGRVSFRVDLDLKNVMRASNQEPNPPFHAHPKTK
jgi:hypothetical protein